MGRGKGSGTGAAIYMAVCKDDGSGFIVPFDDPSKNSGEAVGGSRPN